MSDRAEVSSESFSASGAWASAARLLVRWSEKRERADILLDSLPKSLARIERARVQHLFLGVLRHWSRLESEIVRLVPKPPRVRVRTVLWVSGFELIEAGVPPAPDRPGGAAEGGLVARVVHHAVGQTKALASPAESRLVNAVLRKLAAALAASSPPSPEAGAGALAAYFSHPEWLVRRWAGRFGLASTRALLELHQKPATVFARWRDAESAPPAWLGAPVVPEFHAVPPGRWAEVEALAQAGRIYLHDPATRHAVDLLAPRAGETLLDACAAPGGKSLLIADRLHRASVPEGAGSPDSATKAASTARVIAMDLPGIRLERLRENLSRAPRGVEVALAPADLLDAPARALAAQGLPVAYAGVVVDVPCSNTGVMRHRVDVRWRLQEGDIPKHGRQQLALLHAAARLVAPGGRLVYSTCSLEPEENEDVAGAFLADAQGRFQLRESVVSRPWETGHDGAGAFLLERVK